MHQGEEKKKSFLNVQKKIKIRKSKKENSSMIKNKKIKKLPRITHIQVVAKLEEEARAYALPKNGLDRINLPPAFSINDMTGSEGHSISHEF
jgi:hypothetical protein